MPLRQFKSTLARAVLHGHPGLAYTAPHLRRGGGAAVAAAAAAAARRAGGTRTGRVKIGFVSQNLYHHSTGKWLIGLFTHLNRPALGC